ncbi:MAG TPA: hypothetical protein VGQ28_10735, partial [Thermoanaerobaculia bacterium]|nr:hypothetical protein [Thermoanaerobaculia bacterium]
MSDGKNASTSGACGCCQGTTGVTPVLLANRPGLSALAYRVGTHARFKETELAEISAKDALGKLTTREDDDPAIAILDAWAVTLDVLTFYQERIANEGYLRTATERRSLLELARTIGYELRPGVAASTWLAFTLDGSPGSPREVIIPAGTRAQSLPTKTELPQSFETGKDLLARAEWNALRPRKLEPQKLGSGSTSLFLAGVATQLRPGDALLVVAADGKSGDFRILTDVEADTAAAVTRVAWQEALTVLADPTPKVYALRQRAGLFGNNAPDWSSMTADFKKAYMDAIGFQYDSNAQNWPKEWPDAGTLAAATTIDLDAAYSRIAPESWAVLRATGKTRLFRVTGVDTVSRAGFSLSARVSRLTVNPVAGDGTFGMRETAVFAESEELTPAPQVIVGAVEGKTIELEELVGGLVPQQAVIVQGQRMRARVDGGKLTLRAEDGSRTIELQEGETLEVLARPDSQLLAETWRLRDRDGFQGTVTLQSALFLETPLFEVPALAVEPAALTSRTQIARSRVPGGGFDLPPILRGSRAHLTLVPAEEGDPVVAEVAVLQEVTSDKERTTLKLIDSLANLFDRTTVAVLANVAAATHGETRTEVLGSGDGAKRFQRFRLR